MMKEPNNTIGYPTRAAAPDAALYDYVIPVRIDDFNRQDQACMARCILQLTSAFTAFAAEDPERIIEHLQVIFIEDITTWELRINIQQ